MSKRLQIMIPDDEYEQLRKMAKTGRRRISELVRDSIHSSLARMSAQEPEKKIGKILKFAKFSGPTGDIENILEQIEKGRK